MNSFAKIFLAQDHRLEVKDNFQMQCCFNSEKEENPYRAPFSKLKAFNTIQIKPGGKYEFKLTPQEIAVAIPTLGPVEIVMNKKAQLLEVGEFMELGSTPDTISIENPFSNEWISFIILILDLSPQAEKHIHSFMLENHPNELIALPTKNSRELQLYIGNFEGRKTFDLQIGPNKSAFATILSGAWEIEDRLLAQNDGLGLSGFKMISGESLSNHAMILLIIMND